MTDHLQEAKDFEALCQERRFMRVPRILPSGKEVGIGLTICGDQMIFDDGESSHYWQIRAVEENVSLKIVQDFRNLGVRVIRQ